MTKKKLLVFSDCFIYSGSENVIENILLSEKLKLGFDIFFLYGYNKSYDDRFKEKAEFLKLDKSKTGTISLLSPDWSVYQYKMAKPGARKWVFLVRVLILKTLKFFCVSHVFNFFILKKRIKTLSPDVIYINNGGYPASLQCCVATFAAAALKIKKTYFNINNMATPRNKFFDKLIDEKIDKFVTKFITASFAAQQQAVVTRGLSKNKFVRIPNTIYSDILIAENYKSDKGGDNVFTFGSIGLLTNRKGYHVLLEAVRILVHKFNLTNFVVFIIGEGEDRLLLTDLCKSFDIGNYVSLLGFKPNPLPELNNFDVFVLPSIKNEDFPYVILEAMVLNKPVIGTNVAGIPEQIDDGVTGYLVAPGDPAALAAAMKKMMVDKQESEKMGLLGREKYMTEFCYKIVEEAYFNLFND